MKHSRLKEPYALIKLTNLLEPSSKFYTDGILRFRGTPVQKYWSCMLIPNNSLPRLIVGMCLKENYSDSPSNEYSRHYSAESETEYRRRQGEEQKKRSSRP